METEEKVRRHSRKVSFQHGPVSDAHNTMFCKICQGILKILCGGERGLQQNLTDQHPQTELWGLGAELFSPKSPPVSGWGWAWMSYHSGLALRINKQFLPLFFGKGCFALLLVAPGPASSLRQGGHWDPVSSSIFQHQPCEFLLIHQSQCQFPRFASPGDAN